MSPNENHNEQEWFSPTNLDFLPTDNRPQPLNGLDDNAEEYVPRDRNEVILERFQDYISVLKGRTLTFERVDPMTGELIERVVSSEDESRYSEPGRKKIKRKLFKRLARQHVSGVLLTLTVNPENYGKAEAWETIWKLFAEFRRDLWKYLKRQGREHSPRYVAVLEQHKSGYPHLHVAYPGLRFLAPKEIINHSWKMGYSHVEGGRRNGREVTVSPLGYVLKYVGKMNGWSEEGLAHLWHAKARLYNISHRLYAAPPEPKQPGWKMSGISYFNEEIRTRARRLWSIRFIEKAHTKRRQPANQLLKDIFDNLSAWFGKRRVMQMH